MVGSDDCWDAELGSSCTSLMQRRLNQIRDVSSIQIGELGQRSNQIRDMSSIKIGELLFLGSSSSSDTARMLHVWGSDGHSNCF